MRLSTRLVVLVLSCLLPLLAAQIYWQLDRYTERREQVSASLLQQAELANADVSSQFENVRQLGASVSLLAAFGADAASCPDQMRNLRASQPQYTFLALYRDQETQPACLATESPEIVKNAAAPWIKELRGVADIRAGRVLNSVAPDDLALPIATRLPSGGGVLIAGLRVAWLVRHIRSPDADADGVMAAARLYVLDQGGTLLGPTALPDAASQRHAPAWLMALGGRQSSGVETVTDPNGHAFLLAYVPSEVAPLGISVIAALPAPTLTDDIGKAMGRDLVALCGATCLAMLLAFLISRRLVLKPLRRGTP